MTRLLLTSVLASVALLAGCKPSAETPPVQTTDATAPQPDTIPAATRDVAQELQDFTLAQRAEFITAVRTTLAGLNRSLDALNAKVENAGAPLKAESKPTFDALRQQATTLNRELEKLKGTTEGTWDSARDHVLVTCAGLQAGLVQARQWVDDRIAP